MLCPRLILLLLLQLFVSTCDAGKVELAVCQGPWCSKYGCKNVLLAANLQAGMSGKSAACFGKYGCTTAFPKKGVTVKASGMGVRTLEGCGNPFTAKQKVDSIAKEFGL